VVRRCTRILTLYLRTYLEHLNERDTQVQVGQVSANQAQREEHSDWHNSSKIYFAGHLDCFPSVQELRCASHDLGHDRCENQMPGRE
jgi:hypothetical protein